MINGGYLCLLNRIEIPLLKFYERIAARKFNQLAELVRMILHISLIFILNRSIYKALLIWKVQICRQRMSMICS